MISEMIQNKAQMAKKQNSKKKTQQLTPGVIGDLAEAFGKSYLTITRWVARNDDRLTSEKAKNVFANRNINWN